MCYKAAFLLIVCQVLCLSVNAQNTDSLVKKIDSLRTEEHEVGKPEVDVDKDEYTSRTNLTPKTYVILLGKDFRDIGTSPFHSTHKTWKVVGGFVLLEGAMFFADKPIQRSATTLMTNNPGLRNVSHYITNFGASYEGYILAAFGAYGFIFNSNKVKTTTLLATQAYLTSGAVSYVVKYATGRQRPNYYDPEQPGAEPDNSIFRGPPIFNGNHPGSGVGSSFPSGHTTAAFAAATVFAYEYKDQIVIPVIAYSVAGLVGVSRITENAHWTTDMLAGFALGYICGKQVVNNYHRYARLKAKKPKYSFSFNLDYYDGVVFPGVVCKF